MRAIQVIIILTGMAQIIRVNKINIHRFGMIGRKISFYKLGDAVDIPAVAMEAACIYAFCGLQQNCALQGDTTPNRERALRREALELSLYAFRYLGVDQVVSLVEGRKDGSTNAVFLRRSQLEPELDHPLRSTLPLAAPPSAASPDPKEAPVIDALTSSNTFPGHFEPLPDGDAILVLDVADQATE